MLTIGLENALFSGNCDLPDLVHSGRCELVSIVAPALFLHWCSFRRFGRAVTIFLAIQSINFVVGNYVIPEMQASRQNIDPAIGMLAFSIWSPLSGIPGAILAYPLTLTLMIAFAQFETTRWVAVLISNDGKPAASLEAEAEATSSAGPEISSNHPEV